MDSNISINTLNEILETGSNVVAPTWRSSISPGISLISCKQISEIGEMVAGEISARSSMSFSSYTPGDQFAFDSILNSNFDFISTNILFEKIKDYEQEYKETSENFYKKWLKGNIITTPEVYTWMNTYRILFNHSHK